MVYDRNGNACARLEVMVIFTKPYTTDVLTQEQIIFIAQQLPSPKATTGKPTGEDCVYGERDYIFDGCGAVS
jgi:hypothetical protein